MQLTESSIYINLKRLRNLLYEAQFRMTTANRVVFGNTLMKYSAETISNFILAFTVGDKKLEYLELSLGYFAVLRDDLSFCIEQNIRELSSGWNKYVEFDRHRCCLVARDSNRNRIIKKFNLK